MEEGTLVTWAKKEGDAVEVDDLLAEVETDKATMEFRSFDRGVLLKILADAGSTLAPEAPVAIIGQVGEDVAALLAGLGSRNGRERAGIGVPRPPAQVGVSVQPVPTDHSTGDRPASSPSGRVLASPLVRRLARETGVDLSGVAGSGPGGRVVKRDLETPRDLPGPSTQHAANGLVAPRVERVSQMRKAIARRLTESKHEIPHYYLRVDIDAGPLMAMRTALNSELIAAGQKISVNDLLIKACAIGLREVPQVNASFQGDTIAFHQRIDISVAVAVTDGLITPVVRDADKKTVFEISSEVRELAARAREKRLRPEEFTNGTFSISNLGMFGVDEFAAVINPPEAAILAVGAVRAAPAPSVDGDRVVIGQRLHLTLSCDHRVVDGAVGAEFLAVLRRVTGAGTLA